MTKRGTPPGRALVSPCLRQPPRLSAFGSLIEGVVQSYAAEAARDNQFPEDLSQN